MRGEKENYLEVSYDFKKGLLLRWNFKDIHRHNNYFHHLFVLATTTPSLVETVVLPYFKKMKQGDLIAFVYYDRYKGIVHKNWLEKTHFAHLDLTKINARLPQTPLSNSKLTALGTYAANFLSGSSDNTVVNFLLSQGEEDKVQTLVRVVSTGRAEGSFDYLCTLWGPFKGNSLSSDQAVNFVSVQTGQFEQMMQLGQTMTFFHHMVNSAAIKSAKIRIECPQGQILAYNSRVWNNPDFSRIERTFYGPSINYEEDLIQFQVMDCMEKCEFDMVITLEVELFSRHRVSSNKKIRLYFPSHKHYDKSLNLAVVDACHHVQGLDLQKDPYSTLSFVRLYLSTKNMPP